MTHPGYFDDDLAYSRYGGNARRSWPASPIRARASWSSARASASPTSAASDRMPDSESSTRDREFKGGSCMTVVDRLNELLEAERAGVETLSRLCPEARSPEMLTLFEAVRSDEAWSCAGLARSIKTLGGVMSEKKGDFADKVASEPTACRSASAPQSGSGLGCQADRWPPRRNARRVRQRVSRGDEGTPYGQHRGLRPARGVPRVRSFRGDGTRFRSDDPYAVCRQAGRRPGGSGADRYCRRAGASASRGSLTRGSSTRASRASSARPAMRATISPRLSITTCRACP